MKSAAMIIVFVLAPTLAQQVAKPGRPATLPSVPSFGIQAPHLAHGQRLPPARAFAPEFAPEFAPAFDSGPRSKPSSGFGGSYSNPRSSASYTPPSAEAVQSTAGLSPEQIEFMQRQAAARGGGGYVPASGGLDTHGRPSGGGAPAAAAEDPEYAGMTPDQIEFMKRKKGLIAMSGGLDTHGRPRVLELDETSDESPDIIGILVAGMGGFVTGSALTFFAVMSYRRRKASTAFRQPLLTA